MMIERVPIHIEQRSEFEILHQRSLPPHTGCRHRIPPQQGVRMSSWGELGSPDGHDVSICH